MNVTPTKIERQSDDRLLISWSDGETRLYRAGELRDHCPCATCREKRTAQVQDPSQLTVLSPLEAQPTRVVGMRPVGHYAYSIHFNDGHDTGIFTFELLRQLGENC